MSAVVTELGNAEIYGNDQAEQARQLIEHAAHPSVREELWEEAVALGLLIYLLALVVSLFGAPAFAFGNRRGLVTIGSSLGTLVFLGSVKAIVA